MLRKEELDLQELMLFNSEMRSRQKSLSLCFVMLLGGHLGFHRFYLKRYGTAAAQLTLFIGVVFFYILLAVAAGLELEGMLILSIIGMAGCALTVTVWMIVDIFLVSGMVREWNQQEETRLLQEIWQLRHQKAEEQRVSRPFPS
ncbi:NINE protein [Gorillibacterium sp. CAU 1737]|uniref:NINE protein n=1 Tax=Gorillibacterium sp. CAU 1737 TaxID=3140362 RepID=UPI003260FC29